MSDHQAFWDEGIPSALFIWLNYRKPALPRTCTSGPFSPSYTTEPEYHRPTDGMSNIKGTEQGKAMLKARLGG